MDGLRIGQGRDIHPLAPGRKLLLGGVEIPSPDGRGTIGHSDGDPLLHAVIDAILGSMAMGDIGQWFPDTDPQWKDANSAVLLAAVLQNEKLRRWRLVNLDCTIIAATPRMSPHIPKIRESLAKLLHADLNQISVKAKSDNGMSPAGNGLAIAAEVILLASLPIG